MLLNIFCLLIAINSSFYSIIIILNVIIVQINININYINDMKYIILIILIFYK